ncbi:AI-2E family transporter [Fulvivirga ulvae]|uniref:AI-2E family transporter n=1 Tax=Fulvivirga ulvae TaxID=2904245 RepID=UPI001F29F7C7|nr:AI-2E family transporter [Fulvivirga ulvae]UII32670.1 AI-2E family transporter [Fulvivirga ulvae]
MEKDIKKIKNILSVLLAFLFVYLLSILSSLLIPLALALFIAILLQPVLSWFESKRWPFPLSLTVVSVSSLGVLWLLGMLFYRTGVNIIRQKEYLLNQVSIKLDEALVWINNLPGIEIQSRDLVDIISGVMSYDWLIKSSGQFAGILGDFTGTFFMTAIYLIGFLGGILKYEQYIHYLEEGSTDNDKSMLKGFEQVKSSIVTYMKVKFFVSFLTGLGYFIICWAFGIKFSFFWGFLAFLLNFIPTVGSIIATIPPLLFGLIQFSSIGMVGLLIILLMAVQIIMGNVVEPRITGSSLSLNTIVVILGLVFWGYLWGITGMILSVPLLVLTKVILSQLPDAQLLVRLMGSRTEQPSSPVPATAEDQQE